MLETSDRAGFAGEALPTLGLFCEERMEHLDGDVAMQPLVVAAVDDAHAALPDDLDDLVVQQVLADERIGARGAQLCDATPSRTRELNGLRQQASGRFAR